MRNDKGLVMRNDKELAPPEIASTLTAKQRLFVTEYLVDLNGRPKK
jgi:hypothetical protein